MLLAVPLDEVRLLAESVWEILCSLLIVMRRICVALYFHLNARAWDVRFTTGRLKAKYWTRRN